MLISLSLSLSLCVCVCVCESMQFPGFLLGHRCSNTPALKVNCCSHSFHTHSHTYTLIQRHTRSLTHTHAHTHAHTHTHTHTHTRTHTHAHTHTGPDLCLCYLMYEGLMLFCQMLYVCPVVLTQCSLSPQWMAVQIGLWTT